jgi:hypothetical protein
VGADGATLAMLRSLVARLPGFRLTMSSMIMQKRTTWSVSKTLLLFRFHRMNWYTNDPQIVRTAQSSCSLVYAMF